MPETATKARLKARYLEEIRPALIERFGYSSVMQAPKLEKITLNMGVGLAKQDSKMLKAAQDQLATIAGQQPSVRRAAQVDRGVQTARGHARRPGGHAASRARLRVPRPAGVDRDSPDQGLPRFEPALVRRPRQLHAGREGADHLPRDRLRRDRSGAWPGHHDHHLAPRPTSRRSRCWRRSACRSPPRAGRRSSGVRLTRTSKQTPQRPLAGRDPVEVEAETEVETAAAEQIDAPDEAGESADTTTAAEKESTD